MGELKPDAKEEVEIGVFRFEGVIVEEGVKDVWAKVSEFGCVSQDIRAHGLQKVGRTAVCGGRLGCDSETIGHCGTLLLFVLRSPSLKKCMRNYFLSCNKSKTRFLKSNRSSFLNHPPSSSFAFDFSDESFFSLTLFLKCFSAIKNQKYMMSQYSQ